MTGDRQSFDWSTISDENLRGLFIDQRLSGSQIAERLGGGLTRSAVMGKLARLGLKKGAKTVARSPKKPIEPVTPRPPQPKKQPVERPPREPAVVGPCSPEVPEEELLTTGPGLIESVEQLEPGRCRAPSKDPSASDFGYCDAPAVKGSYCAYHDAMFYKKAAPRRGKK